MTSLRSGARIGTGSVSSLLRSSSSIQSQVQSYNDSLASYEYELSTKSDSDLAKYQSYLNGRVNNLQATGSITDASKALTLTKTITSAVRSNTSSNIQRENIQMMSGNATLQDKYNTIVGQFQRAMSVGDLSLAQQLESQAYSVSQQIQYQAQQSASAAETLAKAGAASAKAARSESASEQLSIAGSLDDALKQLNNDIKNLGVKDFNKVAGKWVDANRDVLQSLGAVIPKGAQPNYFNLVEGIQAAKYNALVLRAQSQFTDNPAAAQNTLRDALLIKNGATKVSTLGGSLTIQEIQQAAQDPSMFAYDYGSGQYKRTTQVGFQYINGQLAPSYSGIIDKTKANQVYFLNPAQTASLTKLGLNFTMNKNGTTGDGVQVQLSENSPNWLKNVLGQNGVTNAFTDRNGNLQFEGAASNGQGLSYFTLVNLGGLQGIFEHFSDGSSRLAGGNYGFDQGAAQLLINMGQQKQYQIELQTKAEQAAQAAQIKLATPQPLPQLKVAPPSAKSVAPGASATQRLQPTVHTQSLQPTYNPQPATVNPQPNAGALPSNAQGVNLGQAHLNTIRL